MLNLPLTRAARPPQPLTAEELADAKAAIEGLVEKGQTLNLKTQARAAPRLPQSACARCCSAAPLTRVPRRPQVKPEIIAGLVVEIGDKYLVRAGRSARLGACSGTLGRVLTRRAPQDLSLDTRIRKMEQLLQQPL